MALLAACSVLLSGCATNELWQEETFAKSHYPASPSDVQLYYSIERKDVLVQYLDHRQDARSATPRAYWLYESLEKVHPGDHPRFVSISAAEGLEAITVYHRAPGTNDATVPDLYAVVGEEGDRFTLYSAKQELDTYDLPSWREPSARVTQVVLTPFAVVFDVAVLGAGIALITS